jgi:hypothetical protein
VVGSPGLTKLRVSLVKAGLTPVKLTLEDRGETVSFGLLRSAGLQELDREHMLRLLISALRRAGFEVGYVEVGTTQINNAVVAGSTLTGPLAEICAIGPPPVGP